MNRVKVKLTSENRRFFFTLAAAGEELWRFLFLIILTSKKTRYQLFNLRAVAVIRGIRAVAFVRDIRITLADV